MLNNTAIVEPCTAKLGRLYWVSLLSLGLLMGGCGGAEDKAQSPVGEDTVVRTDVATSTPDTSKAPVDVAVSTPDTSASLPDETTPPTPLADGLHGGNTRRWDLKQAIYEGVDGAELDITDACALDDYYTFRNDNTYDKHVGTPCRATEVPIANGSWNVDESAKTLLFSEFGPDMPFAIQSVIDDQLWLALDLATVPALNQQGLVRTRFQRAE